MNLNNFSRILLIVIVSVASIGTVFKKKDAIQMTQTDPVRAEDKLKEEAEGIKGPPAPSLNLFPKEKFLSEGPVESEFEEKEAQPEEPISALNEEFKLDFESDDTSKDVWEFEETE